MKALFAMMAGPMLCLPVCLARAEGPVQLVDLDGKQVALGTVQKDATLIAFWSVACVPCIEEMPNLDALAHQLARDGHATLIGVNVDGDTSAATLQRIRNVIADKKAGYRILLDPKGALRKLWFRDPEQMELPTVLVFDRKLHALVSTGFQPGQSADRFIAAWLPVVARVESGKLTKHLDQARLQGDSKPADPEQMRGVLEKMIRSHHPELGDPEVKHRVDGLIERMKKGESVEID